MEKASYEKPAVPRGNGWVSCAIGSGNGRGEIWRCEKCGWEAEIFVWKPAACPRCDHPFNPKRF